MNEIVDPQPCTCPDQTGGRARHEMMDTGRGLRMDRPDFIATQRWQMTDAQADALQRAINSDGMRACW